MVADTSSRERRLSLETCRFSRSLKIPLSRAAQATAVFSSILAALALCQFGASRSRAECLVGNVDRRDQGAAPRTEQALASRVQSRDDFDQKAGAAAGEVVGEGDRSLKRIEPKRK